MRFLSEKWVQHTIQKYISTVFLKLENNTKENENAILKLLNNNKLINSDKEKIISKEEVLISNLSDIENNEVRGILLKLSKTKPVWTNIIDYYVNNENILDENIMLLEHILQLQATLEKKEKCIVQKIKRIISFSIE